MPASWQIRRREHSVRA